MESVSSYYKEEAYFAPRDTYLEPQGWLSCDEQQRLFHYHYNQSKRGLSYANRSRPLHDLSHLPHSVEQQEECRAPRNGVNTEVFYNDRTQWLPHYQATPEFYSRDSVPGRVYHRDVNYKYHHNSPKGSKSNRKSLDSYEHPSYWNGHPDYNAHYTDGRRQNFKHRRDVAPGVIEGPQVYYYDGYHDSPRFPHPGNSVMWHPWPDVSRRLERTAAMSPSSPLDSGLSSQSVASTPNSELEPFSNWDQSSARNGDWFQKPHADMRHAVSEVCPNSLQSSAHDNSRRKSNQNAHHPSPCACVSNGRMHQPGKISSNKNTEVQCKCYSSAESISDSYELRNVCWTFQPENQELDYSNCYSDDTIDSDNRFHRTHIHHSSSVSDGTSESTLKDPSVNLEKVDNTCKRNGEHLRQEEESEVSSQDPDLLYQKQRMKNAKKAEMALCELEEIYNKLNLDDFDLLDRAERRDLPTAHQTIAKNSCKSSPLTRSKSDTFYEIFGRAHGLGYSKSPRAPPLRRAGIPDRVADDMALRKQQKPSTKFDKTISSPSSYLLYSSYFTPSIPPVIKEFPFSNKPDVEQDDLSYRKYFQPKAYHELPQMPFGIPLHPIVQCPSSNYLHATPSNVPRALCHARGNPDLVRDDMAFRNLRKDNG